MSDNQILLLGVIAIAAYFWWPILVFVALATIVGV